MFLKNRIKVADIEFGKEETEAEIDPRSSVQFADVYDDYLNVVKKLENDSYFIIGGRKGTGKSAVARHYESKIVHNEEYVTSHINAVTLNFEALIQTGAEVKKISGNEINANVLFQWLITLSLAKSLMKSEAASFGEGFKRLREFFVKNSGYIEIDSLQMTGALKKYKGYLNVEVLSDLFKVATGKSVEKEFTESKAPIAAVLPSLQKSVIALMQSEYIKGLKFRVIFDELDVSFKSDEEGCIALAELIRVARHYNSEIFGQAGVDAKVMLCLRTDQLHRVKYYTPDIEKILNSSMIKLNWFDYDLYRDNPDALPIKKLIEKRIENAFVQNKKPKVMNSYWDELFDINDDSKTNTFKFFMDHTFYRPRDVVKLLNTIKENYDRALPLPISCIEGSLQKYSKKLGDELINELNMIFDKKEVEEILYHLRQLPEEFHAKEFQDIMPPESKDPEYILEILYEYGVLGTRNGQNQVYFSYWNRDEGFSITNSILIKHLGLRKFLSKQSNRIF